MLRIYRKGDENKFEFRRIDRSQCGQVIGSFLANWGKEFTEPFEKTLDPRTADPSNTNTAQPPSKARTIPISEYVIEWQNGDGDWDETKPVEKIRIVN